jgi:hypothetical protein
MTTASIKENTMTTTPSQSHYALEHAAVMRRKLNNAIDNGYTQIIAFVCDSINELIEDTRKVISDLRFEQNGVERSNGAKILDLGNLIFEHEFIMDVFSPLLAEAKAAMVAAAEMNA